MRLSTIKNTANLYKYAFTTYSLRNLIAKRKYNGLDKVIYKLGKKILIDLDKFEKWIEQNEIGGAK